LKAVCADLKAIYRAPSEEAGRAALEQFGEKWQSKYPLIYQSWDANRPDLCEFFKYPEEIRRVIYTTNAIESLNYQLRKVTRNRSVLVSDEAIYKIMYLALRNAARKAEFNRNQRDKPQGMLFYISKFFCLSSILTC
jgi:transposase-like protein